MKSTPQITVRKNGTKTATLGNVVDALETSAVSLGIPTALASGYRQAKIEGTWRAIDNDPTVRVLLRLAFERNGFRSVSNRLLSDALTVAKLPPIQEVA